MQIEDKHFIYPHELSDDDVIARIVSVFKRSPNAAVFLDEKYDIPNSIWRWCKEYDLNPAWPLISLQRERSLLGKLATSPSDWDFACGYVGQDAPGTKNKRWNGLVNQLWLCIHQTAWLAGFGVPDNYGVKENLHPRAPRWIPAHDQPIKLLDVEPRVVTPCNIAEHVIYTYTPHAEAFPRAGQLLSQFVAEFA